jgi:hypothetical protein
LVKHTALDARSISDDEVAMRNTDMREPRFTY